MKSLRRAGTECAGWSNKEKEKKEKGYIAVPACGGSLAEAKKTEKGKPGSCLLNPQVTAEHMCAPFLAGRRRIRQFAPEHHLMDRPHTMLGLTKA
eukprot:1142396-Pelagomonas_calceolata.AAC.1